MTSAIAASAVPHDHPDLPPPNTVRQAILRYLADRQHHLGLETRTTYECALAGVLGPVLSEPLVSLDAARGAALRLHTQGLVGYRTFFVYWGVAGHWARWCVQRGWLAANPLPGTRGGPKARVGGAP